MLLGGRPFPCPLPPPPPVPAVTGTHGRRVPRQGQLLWPGTHREPAPGKRGAAAPTDQGSGHRVLSAEPAYVLASLSNGLVPALQAVS